MTGEEQAVGEGLFVPGRVELPFELDPVLRSLVRVPTLHQYCVATVFEAEEDRAMFLPEQGSKTFLPEGVVLWHLALTRDDLEEIRADWGLRLRPLLHEAVEAFEGIDDFPAQRIVPLDVAALGVFVAPDGRFLTNYHVAGEEIEAAGRTGGSETPHRCAYTSFETPRIERGAIVGWEAVGEVFLLRNLSREDWRDGYDAALLGASGPSQGYLPPTSRPPRLGEEVWSFGLPVRTRRAPERLREIGYPDADGSLRVARGRVVDIPSDHTFISDADSFSGCSGGPVLSAAGELLGINWNVHPHGEVDRRAVVFEGGSIHVMASAAVERLGV